MRDRSLTRVLVADDHPMYRLGLAMALRALGFGSVDEAENGHDAVRRATSDPYDVVLLDLQMPGRSGIDAAQAIVEWADAAHETAPVIIMLTTFHEPVIVRCAVSAGVKAFLGKETEPGQLATTIDDLLSGRRATIVPSSEVPPLSDRELDVLRMLARGESAKSIAKLLSLSPETVKDHIASVYAKLDVRDRVSAVVKARQIGWLVLDEIELT